MRLLPGQEAPLFEVSDILGGTVRLADRRGAFTLLALHRYSSCPFCNLRIATLRARHAELERRGLGIVAVFESSAQNLREGVALQALPFSIISDPTRHLYGLYGAEHSVAGLVRTALTRMGSTLEAKAAGLVPKVAREGARTRMPSDFLIGPDLRILRAHYGQDLGDHLAIEQIEQALMDRGSGA